MSVEPAAFLHAAAGDGPAVGLALAGPGGDAPSTAGTAAVARRISGAAARTLDELFTAFARAWDFPAHFGGNKDAFDDAVLDLNPRLFTATGAPARGYLTVITEAEQLLNAADPDDFGWFAESIDYYRADYRDRSPADRRGFAVLLVSEPAAAAAVRERWTAAGVAPVAVACSPVADTTVKGS